MAVVDKAQLMEGQEFELSHGFEADQFYLVYGGTDDDPEEQSYCVAWYCGDDKVLFRACDGEQMAAVADLKIALIELPEDPENAV